ncbi:hypothetical protein [Singulisphaera sp. PoT]|uniref:hypothetical protein n=1 Tax=Singulisphaera sp. PoT TaxID=3411797 RepID=UPI003BF50B76
MPLLEWARSRLRRDGLLICTAAAVLAIGLGVWMRKPRAPESNRIADALGLPSEAKDIKLLGNDWYSFSLEVGGKRRQFLRHNVVGLASSAESIVELAP